MTRLADDRRDVVRYCAGTARTRSSALALILEEPLRLVAAAGLAVLVGPPSTGTQPGGRRSRPQGRAHRAGAGRQRRTTTATSTQALTVLKRSCADGLVQAVTPARASWSTPSSTCPRWSWCPSRSRRPVAFADEVAQVPAQVPIIAKQQRTVEIPQVEFVDRDVGVPIQLQVQRLIFEKTPYVAKCST